MLLAQIDMDYSRVDANHSLITHSHALLPYIGPGGRLT